MPFLNLKDGKDSVSMHATVKQDVHTVPQQHRGYWDLHGQLHSFSLILVCLGPGQHEYQCICYNDGYASSLGYYERSSARSFVDGAIIE